MNKKSSDSVNSVLTALSTLPDALPDLIFYKDLYGTYLGCNQAFCDFVGRENKSKVIGKTDYDLFDKEQADFFSTKDSIVLNANIKKYNDEWVTYPDGREVFLHTLKAPFLNKKGDVIGLVGICRDITTHHQAQLALQDSLQRYQLFFEASHEALFTLSLETGCFISANQAAIKLFGASKESQLTFLGPKEVSTQYQQDGSLSSNKVQEQIDIVMQEGSHFFEWRHQKLDGTPFSTDVSMTRMTIAEDTFIYCSIHDISNRKNNELLEKCRSDMMESMATEDNFHTILDKISLSVEQQNPEMLCSILLLDEEKKHLLTGAAPSLPDFYNAAVHGMEIGMGAGSCGTAAFTGKSVIVDNTQTHPYWVAFKELAKKAELFSCWSEPIYSSQGKILGTFAIYHRYAHQPTKTDIQLIEQSAHLTSIAIEKHQTRLALNSSEERWKFALEGAGDGVWDLNLKTNHALYSKRWKEMLGYNEGDIIPNKQEWVERLHPEDKDVVRETLQSYLEGRIPTYVVTFRMRCKDGSYKWILARGMIVERDVHNNPLRLVGTHQDISEQKNNEEKMALTSLLLNESQQVGKLGGWKLDIKTGDLFWTDETYRIHETSPEEFNPTVDAGVDFYLPDSKKVISDALEEAINHGVGFDLELETYTAKSNKIDVRATCVVTIEEGVPICLTGIFQDISTQRKHQRKLEQTNLDLANANAALTLAASVFSHAGECIIITDISGTIVDVNETFKAITGFSREEAIGQNPRFLKSGRQSSEFYTEMWQTLLKEDYWTGEVWNRRKDGEVYAVMTTISAVRDRQGNVTHFVSLGNDITPMKEHQNQLEHIAHYDVLTGLPNRSLLADRLSQAMLQCKRNEKSLAVVFLDLDGFKYVNDTYGHGVGDELLIALSVRMQESLRDGDTLSRIGGDEFVAVLADLDNVEDCEPVLERLLMAASEPIPIGNIVLKISASVGVTLYPQDNADADQLMRHADQAMYVAKESGKNRYHLFDTAQDDALKLQRESLEAIRSALDNHQFVLHYQPKVNMRTGLVVGVEALIRWQHPERGLLNPIDFLPIIENHPMSIEVGEWVIDTALTQISQWQATELSLPLSTSVNIAAVQLQQSDFIQRLTTILAAHPDVEPGYLEFEILETSAIEDVSHISTIMNDCMALGVNFSLDDFGTGYSSLTYLRRLPASLIKIDQTFVRDMLIDVDDLAIVEGVIALAKSFKRDVIAEGVETIEHGTALLRLGCDLAQGYGIARPMPASDIPLWISAWKPDVSWQS